MKRYHDISNTTILGNPIPQMNLFSECAKGDASSNFPSSASGGDCANAQELNEMEALGISRACMT